MKKYLKLMRIHHYLKNGLIFLPLIFNGSVLNGHKLIDTILGFIGFSLTSSIVYILNDIRDLENDRKHPTKCKRPLASGEISINSAKRLIGGLCACIIWVNFILGNNVRVWVYLVSYLGINIFYSIKGKEIALLDVAILVIGFVIRVLYGAQIGQIQVSNWLYLTVMTMSFYLGLGKRRNEMNKYGDSSRSVLRQYNIDFLDKNMYMSLGLTLVFYSLWTIDSATIENYGDDRLIWTVPFVMLICMKYSLIVEGESDGDPIEVIMKDRVLKVMIMIYMIIIFTMLYIC